MKKEEIIQALEAQKIDTSLTQDGEIRTELLQLALKGATADAQQTAVEAQKKAYEKTIKTLNERIEELEARKTPAEKAGLVIHKKSKKKYSTASPKCTFKGRSATAEILNNDQGLLEEMIESKTPWLIEEEA